MASIGLAGVGAGAWNSHDLHPHCFFFLFLKPEAARGNPASSLSTHPRQWAWEKRKNNTRSRAPALQDRPTHGVTRHRPSGPSAIVLPPSFFARTACSFLRRNYAHASKCASQRVRRWEHPATISCFTLGLLPQFAAHFVILLLSASRLPSRRAAAGEAGLKINFFPQAHS